MSYPLVRELAAEGIPVRLACGVLGFSAQAYYAWLARPVTDREWADAHTINALREAHEQDPEFGYRFLVDEVVAGGHALGERRGWRLCSQQAVVDHDEEGPPRRRQGARPGGAR
jgi:putative transposase